MAESGDGHERWQAVSRELSLSPRETQVAQGVFSGRTELEIAALLQKQARRPPHLRDDSTHCQAT